MELSEKLLYSRVDAAHVLSLSVSTLDVAIARGMIRVRREGRRVFVEKRELERFSRTDHPHIWALNGTRGTRIAGRECFDCDLAGSITPAIRFIARVPLCQVCFDERMYWRSEAARRSSGEHRIAVEVRQ